MQVCFKAIWQTYEVEREIGFIWIIFLGKYYANSELASEADAVTVFKYSDIEP